MFILSAKVPVFGVTIDTIRVSWDCITNRLCLNQLVWCALTDENGVDSSGFATIVSNRNGSIIDWKYWVYDVVAICVVEVPTDSNLVTEANAYDNIVNVS